LATFLIGILSGFGLGAIIFWITFRKRIKTYFIVACELIERFDFMMDALTEDNEGEDEEDGDLQADCV
jgi:hypothetical protein